jgi:copper(I)-binding protein
MIDPEVGTRRYDNGKPESGDDMQVRQALFTMVVAIVASATQPAAAAGRLVVEKAWIRAAPPGATMLAGYAILRNAGDAAVVVSGVASDAFGAAALHETVEVDGVERMRALGPVEIAPGATVVLAPGGRHLMLMRPRQPVAAGASAKVHFDTNQAGGADADFVVREEAPADH